MRIENKNKEKCVPNGVKQLKFLEKIIINVKINVSLERKCHFWSWSGVIEIEKKDIYLSCSLWKDVFFVLMREEKKI